MTDEVLIRFRLVGDEAQAMRELSAQELRKPRDQVRHILRQALKQKGLLPSQDAHQQTSQTQAQAQAVQ